MRQWTMGWRGWAICAVFAAQLAVPAWTIVDREVTLAIGDTFRFKTTVVDPVDVFRGRYVRVGLMEDSLEVEDPRGFARDRIAYASIQVDENGYASFSALSLEPPADGPYMKVRTWPRGGSEIQLRPPFDRYFMNENLAREAQRVYREHSGDRGDAYLNVAVKDGRPVVEGLYIEGEPIEDYVRRLQDRPTGGA